jgi:hypothetical protein
MSDAPKDNLSTHWATLNQEVHQLEDALNHFTLVGVLDRDTNHISSMQEEIDRKTREALVDYWLSIGQGEMPRDISQN